MVTQIKSKGFPLAPAVSVQTVDSPLSDRTQEKPPLRMELPQMEYVRRRRCDSAGEDTLTEEKYIHQYRTLKYARIL